MYVLITSYVIHVIVGSGLPLDVHVTKEDSNLEFTLSSISWGFVGRSAINKDTF